MSNELKFKSFIVEAVVSKEETIAYMRDHADMVYYHIHRYSQELGRIKPTDFDIDEFRNFIPLDSALHKFIYEREFVNLSKNLFEQHTTYGHKQVLEYI